ncbi:hypothetical protein FRC06_010796, partial [Ceratobasidium sp. 370]
DTRYQALWEPFITAATTAKTIFKLDSPDASSWKNRPYVRRPIHPAVDVLLTPSICSNLDDSNDLPDSSGSICNASEATDSLPLLSDLLGEKLANDETPDDDTGSVLSEDS